MAKNLLSMLSFNNIWWVSIMENKYGTFYIWKGSAPAKCSWFYRGLYHNLVVIRPFLWINFVNPNITSFLNDPWYFEIPIAIKPTY